MGRRFWVVAIGEPLPTDGDKPRLLRAGIIARMLADAGHEVTWWTSNFNHTRKKKRFPHQHEERLGPALRMILLDGEPYRLNVSLGRIRNHRQIATAFQQLAEREQKPDAVLCSYPSIELAKAIAEFGQRSGVPTIMDVRDLWPDVIAELAPGPLRWLSRLALGSMYRDARNAMQTATAVVGVTEEYRDWGLALAKRPSGPFDRVFPLAYSADIPPVEEQADARTFWQSNGVSDTDGKFNVVFFGALGRQFDLVPVIESARLLHQRGSAVRFIVCGAGERLDSYRAMSNRLDNIMFPGWVDANKIWMLMRLARLGIAPYIDSENFRKNIPNKIIEYMSAGLPVVTSLRGAVAKLLTDGDFGYFYGYGSGAELADVLTEAAGDTQTLKRKSDNARQLFERSYTTETVYGGLIKYLEEIALRNAEPRTLRAG